MSRHLGTVRKWFHWVVDAEPPLNTTRQPGSNAGTRDSAERDGANATFDARTFHYERLRFWVAMGIVLVAISAAAAAWRAEIFMEYATQKEALFRQDLSGQQLSERSDEELVISELRQLAPYEQDLQLAKQTQAQADQASGRAAALLGAEAQNDWMIVDHEATYDFSSGPGPLTLQDGNETVNPAVAYAAATLSDPTLATFDPADLDSLAHRARGDAEAMAAVSVLFALTVVLLTLSEMRLRRRTAGPAARWTVGHTIAVVSVLMWLLGAVLFTLLYLDVPHLQ